jgi:SWI/SNF-related matrix-associated actin-dependent regulator 1 of chromatin subfamily A
MINLYPYQKKTITFALKRKRAILALDQGLGKTIISIFLFKILQAKKILIISPASLKLNWKREIINCFPFLKKHIEIISTGKQALGLKNITIINYDLLSKPQIHSQLISQHFNILILDELHYLKNPEAARTKAILGSKNRKKEIKGVFTVCDRVYGLTGTPIPNRPIEMFSWLNALFPEQMDNMGYYEYAKVYCEGWQAPWGFDVSGASNIKELREKIKPIMIRYTKKKVLKDLPEKTKQLILLERDRQTGDVIKREAEYDIKELIQKQNSLAFEGLSELRHEMGLAKLPVCVKYIKDWLDNNENEKLVIFAHHRDVISQLESSLSKYKCAAINGETSLTKRDQIVTDFQTKSNDLRILIGNIASVGTGLTLHKASTAIFVEFSWVSGELIQAEDRLHRIGQKNPVFIKYLVIDGSLDSYMLDKVIKKQSVIDDILED